jgi:hypothetical protein
LTQQTPNSFQQDIQVFRQSDVPAIPAVAVCGLRTCPLAQKLMRGRHVKLALNPQLSGIACWHLAIATSGIFQPILSIFQLVQSME